MDDAPGTTHRALAELKGLASSMPHPEVLVNTLALQEAKASSEIENLVTTQDELFRAQVDAPEWRNRPTREVFRYVQAMRVGQAALKEHGWLTMHLVEEIQIQLLGNDAGFRRQAGTVLKNDRTGEIVYTPPANPGPGAETPVEPRTFHQQQQRNVLPFVAVGS
jgi:Fic family protein